MYVSTDACEAEVFQHMDIISESGWVLGALGVSEVSGYWRDIWGTLRIFWGIR